MNDLNPNISIIVPVYNVEKYLVRCLDSIFNQEFSGSFEVIAVEDASTDNSLQLLKSYQENETRLKVIEHGVNKKLSVARASGMKAAKGDYIMHVDSDDWLLPNILDDLYTKCFKSGADVMVYNYVTENNRGQRKQVREIQKELITNDKEKVQKYFLGACWNKIAKRNLTENMIYGKVGINMGGEDLLYSSEILLRAKTIYLSPTDCYVYYNNDESMSVIHPKHYLCSQVIVFDQISALLTYYNSTLSFTNYLMNYLEKYIYLELAKIHYWHKELLMECNLIIRQLFMFPIMTKARISRLEISMNNNFICLLEVIWRCKLKTAIWVFIKSYRK